MSDECKSAPLGFYGVWAEVKKGLREPRWITDKPISYEEAVRKADYMCRSNKQWHYMVKLVPPPINISELRKIYDAEMENNWHNNTIENRENALKKVLASLGLL